MSLFRSKPAPFFDASLARLLLTRFAATLPPPRVITDRETGGRPYLSRYYLFGKSRDGADESGSPVPFNVFLHRFHRSDDDGALHSHPWEWAVSFVLVGGYSEERRVGDEVERREVRPFSFNVITDEDFHRVDLRRGRVDALHRRSEDGRLVVLLGPLP